MKKNWEFQFNSLELFAEICIRSYNKFLNKKKIILIVGTW